MALLTTTSMRPHSLTIVSTSQLMSADWLRRRRQEGSCYRVSQHLSRWPRRCRIDVIDDDMDAFARIGQYDIAADAAAAASNQRHLVLQSHRVPPKLFEIRWKNHAKAAAKGRQDRPASKMAPMSAIFALKESFGGLEPPLPDKMAEPKRNDPAPLSPQPVPGG